MQESILTIFLRVGTIDKIHLQRDCRSITALVKFCLRRLAHFFIALRFCLFTVAFHDFFCICDLQIHPFRCWIIADIWTVDIRLRQVQDLTVPVLTRWHDPRNDAGRIKIIRYPQQILGLTDLNAGVVAHAPCEEHIVPIACKFSVGLFYNALIAQQSFYRIDMFKPELTDRIRHIRIKTKIMWRHTSTRYALNDGTCCDI